MTSDTRGAIADLAVLGAVSVALYFVATTPPLRRVVWRALKYGAFTAAPALLRQEITRAWLESAPLESASGHHRTRAPSASQLTGAAKAELLP
jgi:hypothetical protein